MTPLLLFMCVIAVTMRTYVKNGENMHGVWCAHTTKAAKRGWITAPRLHTCK